jgi:tetratricopeptide (TPR) repeat protein
MDIGARHLIPIYPFLYALAGFTLAQAFVCSRPWAIAALAMAQQAVALAPDSALTQISLADTLASQKQWAEAIDHYRRAEELARTIRPELQDEGLIPRSEAGIAQAQKNLTQPN